MDDESGEPIEIPVEDTLDLHPFRPNEIRDVAIEYLREARARGFREVRLIHGRGKGVQRASLQSVLATLPWVEAFYDADAHRGATVVVLRDVSDEERVMRNE